MNTLLFSARGLLHENFPTDVRRELLINKFWKLAEKSIEDRFTRISQPMCVEDCSKKNLEVGEEVHRRLLHENFPTEKNSEIGEEVH